MPNQLTFNYQILIHIDSRASNKTYQREQYKSTKALKETVHPEMEMLSSFTHPVLPNLFVSFLFFYLFLFFLSFFILFSSLIFPHSFFLSFPSFHLCFLPLFFLFFFLPSKTEDILKNVHNAFFLFWKHWNYPKCIWSTKWQEVKLSILNKCITYSLPIRHLCGEENQLKIIIHIKWQDN